MSQPVRIADVQRRLIERRADAGVDACSMSRLGDDDAVRAMEALIADRRAASGDLPLVPPPPVGMDRCIRTWAENAGGQRTVAVAEVSGACGQCLDGWTWRPAKIVEGRGVYAEAGDETALYTIAVACDCRRAHERAEAFNRARLDGALRDASLHPDVFDWTQRAVIHHRDVIGEWRRVWRPGGRGLFMIGKPGTGKTHIAAALLRYFTLDRGVSARWVSWPALLDDARDACKPGGLGSVRDLVSGMLAVDLIVVDEVGAGGVTEFSVELSEKLLCRRLDAGMSIVATTNLPETGDELTIRTAIGDRAWSRLKPACELLTLVGDDYRQRRTM